MGYFYIFLTVVFTVYGQLIIKSEVNTVTFPTDGNSIWFLIQFCFRPLVMSGLFSAVFASFAWIFALSKFDMSYAYPFMSLNFIFVILLSVFLFGENFDVYKLAGIVLICLGLFTISRSGAI